MAVTSMVVQGVTNASTGNQDFTSSGFGTPDAAIIIVNSAKTTANPASFARISVGFLDGTSQNCSGIFCDDTGGTSTTKRYHSTSICAAQHTTSGFTMKGIGSLISDGVRINWTTAFGDAYITILLIKGVTSVKVGAEVLSTTGVNDITSIGFKPSLCFFHTIGLDTAPEAVTDHATFSFGAAHNNSSDVVSQIGTMFCSRNGVGTTIVNGSMRDDSCVGLIYNDAKLWNGAAQDFDVNGFSINTGGDNPTNDYIYYLALELADPDDAWVGIIDTPTSTGNTSYTAPGFEPQNLILSQMNAQALNTIITDGDGASFAFGMADGATEQSLGMADEDTVGTQNSSAYANTSNVAQLYGDDMASTSHVASLNAFLSNGFQLNFSDTDGTARKWAGISLSAGIISAVTGTATASIDDTDIVAGGKTIILTLTNDTWVTAGATFDAQRQNIIDGLDSAQSEGTGWNAEVRDKEVVGAVVRTGDTVVTITLTASASYDITAQEVITTTVPATALTTSTGAVVSTPTFTVVDSDAVTNQTVVCNYMIG